MKIEGINIRFLAQGMVKVPLEELPPNFAEMSKPELQTWANEYLWQLKAEGLLDAPNFKALLDAIAQLDLEDNAWAGGVEAFDGENHRYLMMTEAWRHFLYVDLGDKIVDAPAAPPTFRPLTVEKIIDLPEDQKQAYLHAPSRCPFCLGDNLEGNRMEADGKDSWQAITCLECNSEWRDLYRLVGMDYDHIGSPEEIRQWADLAQALREKNLEAGITR